MEAVSAKFTFAQTYVLYEGKTGQVIVNLELFYGTGVYRISGEGLLSSFESCRADSGKADAHITALKKANDFAISELRRVKLSDLHEIVNKSNALDQTSIQDLGLSVRCYNALTYYKIKTLGDLKEYDLTELKRMRNFGARSLAEVKEVLQQYNLLNA